MSSQCYRSSPLYHFLSELDSNNIPYVCWKNNHLIYNCLSGKSDIDLYIPPTFKSRVLPILSNTKWFQCDHAYLKFPHIHHFYFCDFPQIYHIHLYFCLITGETLHKEYILPFADRLISNRVRHRDYHIWVPSPEDYLFLFTLRVYIKNLNPLSRFIFHRDLLDYTAEFLSIPSEAINFPPRFPHLDISLRHLQITNGILKKPPFFLSLYYSLVLLPFLRRNPLSLLITRVLTLIRLLINRVFLRRKKLLSTCGFSVALCGSDGSGKSTLLKSISSYYSSFLTVKVLSLGKPHLSIFPFSFFRNFSFNHTIKPISPSHKLNEPTGLIQSFKYFLLAVMRLIVAYKVRYYVSRGFLVLVDRWPSSSSSFMDSPRIIQSSSSNILISSLALLESWIYKSFPRVDLAIHLKTSLSTAIKRNKLRSKLNKETDYQISYRYSTNLNFKPLSTHYVALNNEGTPTQGTSCIVDLISRYLSYCQ